MNQHPADSTKKFANATRGLRHVFVTRLALQARIGIHPHERQAPQTIWVSVDAAVAEQDMQANASMNASIDDVVCYEGISNEIAEIVASGHIDLVETLAETIADTLMEDKRIVQLQVRVEKPDAIAAAESVGIAIERLQTP
jgi:dihydroneopterin aldolase